jgi:hypothetical protein
LTSSSEIDIDCKFTCAVVDPKLVLPSYQPQPLFSRQSTDSGIDSPTDEDRPLTAVHHRRGKVAAAAADVDWEEVEDEEDEQEADLLRISEYDDDDEVDGVSKLAGATSPAESSGYGTSSPPMFDDDDDDPTYSSEEIDVLSVWSPPSTKRSRHDDQSYDSNNNSHSSVVSQCGAAESEHNYSLSPHSHYSPQSTSSNTSFSCPASRRTPYYVTSTLPQSSHQLQQQTRQRGRPRRNGGAGRSSSFGSSSSSVATSTYRIKRSGAGGWRKTRIVISSSNNNAKKASCSASLQHEHNFKERLRRVQLRDELHALRACLPEPVVRTNKKRISSDDILRSAAVHIRGLEAEGSRLDSELDALRAMNQRYLMQLRLTDSSLQ